MMQRGTNAQGVYKDLIGTIGYHNKTIADNVHVLTCIKYTNSNCKYCIETSLAVPYCQHQNCSQGIGGNF